MCKASIGRCIRRKRAASTANSTASPRRLPVRGRDVHYALPGMTRSARVGNGWRSRRSWISTTWEVPPPKLLNTPYPIVFSVIGADVAEGIGADYSVAVVRDAKDRGLKAALRTP